MWEQNALGYVISKITLIPYFIKTNHLDIIKLYILENSIAYCSALGNYFVIYIHHKFFFRGWKESEGFCNYNFSVAAGKLTIFQRRILVYYKYTYK